MNQLRVGLVVKRQNRGNSDINQQNNADFRPEKTGLVVACLFLVLLFCTVVCWDRTETSAGFRVHPKSSDYSASTLLGQEIFVCSPLALDLQGFAFLDLLWELVQKQHKPNDQVVSLTIFCFCRRKSGNTVYDTS